MLFIDNGPGSCTLPSLFVGVLIRNTCGPNLASALAAKPEVPNEVDTKALFWAAINVRTVPDGC